MSITPPRAAVVGLMINTNEADELTRMSAYCAEKDSNFDRMEDLIPANSDPFSEGLCRYMNQYLAPDTSYPAWDNYSLTYHGGLGAKVGFTFEIPVTSWMNFEINANYRYLKFLEHVQGKHNLDHPGQSAEFWAANYWTIRYDRDFSAFMIGGSINIPF